MSDDAGLVASSLSMLRLIAGWACSGLGLLNLAMGIDTRPGTTDGSYLLFHAVLLITGAALMGLGVLRKRPGPAAYAVGAAIAVLGPLLSALPRTTIVCCLLDRPSRHGFPFTALAGGSGRWHLAAVPVAADLLFWAFAGFLALLLVTLLRPARKVPSRQPAPSHATHAEQRAPAAADENVGGLP
jgi:hypothetical protein